MESYTEQMFYDAFKNGDTAILKQADASIAKYHKDIGNYNGLVLAAAYDALRTISKPVEPEFHKHYNTAAKRFYDDQQIIANDPNMRGRNRKVNMMVGNAMLQLRQDAKEYVFQNYPTKSNVVRNVMIKNAHSFGLTHQLINILKENGDVMKVIWARNPHIDGGHGRVFHQNQYWILTPDQNSMLQQAIINEIPVKNYGEKWNNFVSSRHSHFPFSNMGMHELENIMKLEECAWEQYLIQLEKDYVCEREEKVKRSIEKSVDDEIRIEKHGLTNLF